MTTEPQMDAATDTAGSTNINIGATLTSQRIALELDERQVATALKISIEQVRALEANQFEKFRSITFARGFLKSYCRLVKLNEVAMIAAFDSLKASPEPNIKPVDKVNKQTHLGDPIIVLISVLIAAVIIFLAFWWPTLSQDDEGIPATLPDTQQESSSEQQSVQPNLSDDVVTQDLATLPEQTSVIDPIVDLSSDEDVVTGLSAEKLALLEEAGVSEEVVVQATKQATVKAPLTTTPESAPVSSYKDEIVMDFSADCWTEVRDNSGRILYSGVKSAGSQLTLNGQAPYRVVLGYAPGVSSLVYKGEQFDFSSFVGKDLARFELK
ncbi:RodZ domain-containing protein [Marinomonas sp.]